MSLPRCTMVLPVAMVTSRANLPGAELAWLALLNFSCEFSYRAQIKWTAVRRRSWDLRVTQVSHTRLCPLSHCPSLFLLLLTEALACVCSFDRHELYSWQRQLVEALPWQQKLPLICEGSGRDLRQLSVATAVLRQFPLLPPILWMFISLFWAPTIIDLNFSTCFVQHARLYGGFLIFILAPLAY